MILTRWFLITLLMLAVSASQATAVGLLDDLLTVSQEGVGSMTLTGEMLGCSISEKGSGGSFQCDGSGQSFVPANPDFTWELSNWNLGGEFDPFVSSAFGFANAGAATSVFTITVSIPVIPLGPSTLMGGSTGGSVTDSNFDGLGGLSTSAPTAFFSGLIDGVPVGPTAELHPDPFSLGFAFPGETVAIPPASFGLPGPTVPGPPVAATIGIMNKFSLSAGDSVASTNFFVVEPIPEPSTALLLGLGLMALGLRQRSPESV